MKGFSRQNLEAFEVNAMAFVKLEVLFGKILADNADQFDGAKETGGDRGMAGRAAE